MLPKIPVNMTIFFTCSTWRVNTDLTVAWDYDFITLGFAFGYLKCQKIISTTFASINRDVDDFENRSENRLDSRLQDAVIH